MRLGKARPEDTDRRIHHKRSGSSPLNSLLPARRTYFSYFSTSLLSYAIFKTTISVRTTSNFRRSAKRIQECNKSLLVAAPNNHGSKGYQREKPHSELVETQLGTKFTVIGNWYDFHRYVRKLSINTRSSTRFTDLWAQTSLRQDINCQSVR